MTSSHWRNLPLQVKEVSIHEAGHAVVAELLGWPVRYLRLHRSGDGLCMLRGKPPAPWVDLIVSAAGHAAECWWSGGREPSVFGGFNDRRDGAKAMERAGVDKADCPFAACEAERWLWPVFGDRAVGGAVTRVAKALARRRYLDRPSLLKAADLESVRHIRETVRRYCLRLAVRLHQQHLEGSS